MKTVDIICPVFNEEDALLLFFERFNSVFDQLKSEYKYRLIFVNNASTDQTYKITSELAGKYDYVSLITLSRNFGYQCSVQCGLTYSTADFTGVVDVDCEDPPELFIKFLEEANQGYDLVYGERVDRVESELIKAMRKLFYRLTRAVSDDHFILDMAEFCLMSRQVRESVLNDNNSFPFIRASIGRVGFNIKNIPFKREMRIAGTTNYNFWRMFIFAVAGILSSSTLWLRIPAYLFPIWFISFVGLNSLYFVTKDSLYIYTLLSLTSLFVVFSVTGIGIYLARTYKNGLNRPNFVVDKNKTLISGH
ncbi:glycosyltransferase family 2 protein [Acetoanaerobium sticklandii]|uniref:glycosyltransferase family 2 protein n=1 Tax=Acetoanaerobium sticklandii TaxID=1511 RepID=UPI003A8E32F2